MKQNQQRNSDPYQSGYKKLPERTKRRLYCNKKRIIGHKKNRLT